MKRIRIWADTHSTGIFDEIGRTLRREETTISESTWTELEKWVLDYDFVIPLSQQERSMRSRTIEELDNKGVSLLKKIRTEWKKDIASGEKIQFLYYSEGFLKYLPIDGEIVIQ